MISEEERRYEEGSNNTRQLENMRVSFVLRVETYDYRRKILNVMKKGDTEI